jgi:hypothetical protein
MKAGTAHRHDFKSARQTSADIRERLARWLAPDLLFNSDMSGEVDRLHEEVAQLRDDNLSLEEEILGLRQKIRILEGGEQ